MTGAVARRFHIDATTFNKVTKIVRENVNRESIVMSDEGSWYQQLGGHFFSHDTENHSAKECVRGDITTNGVYQHCSEKHLHRYLAEFDFRYSNRTAVGVDDASRAGLLAHGIKGKRLTIDGLTAKNRPAELSASQSVYMLAKEKLMTNLDQRILALSLVATQGALLTTLKELYYLKGANGPKWLDDYEHQLLSRAKRTVSEGLSMEDELKTIEGTMAMLQFVFIGVRAEITKEAKDE